MAKPPVLVKPIPPQIVNEGAAFGPFNLKEYIESPDADSGTIRFMAELTTGAPLPKGLICTSEGIVSGIPAQGTMGTYDVLAVAENLSGIPFTAEFKLTIKERLTLETKEFLGDIKSRIWEALGKDLPIPEMGELLNRPVTAIEIYYLLQRWATLTIWDVYNLDSPGEKKLLTLEGCSSHYNIYDRGSCIIGAPKDLYSNERTLEDALQTSRAMAREVYNRGWVIEFAGFDKMVRAAWVELRHLSDKFGKEIEILHYVPTTDDLRIYTVQSQGPGMKF
ncbi:MAG: Ig domain-containing protein [Gammaproteobacteria bacterium]